MELSNVTGSISSRLLNIISFAPLISPIAAAPSVNSAVLTAVILPSPSYDAAIATYPFGTFALTTPSS